MKITDSERVSILKTLSDMTSFNNDYMRDEELTDSLYKATRVMYVLPKIRGSDTYQSPLPSKVDDNDTDKLVGAFLMTEEKKLFSSLEPISKKFNEHSRLATVRSTWVNDLIPPSKEQLKEEKDHTDSAFVRALDYTHRVISIFGK